MTSPQQMNDEDLMARILQDAETTTIADSLGIEPADYAARVMHYIRNPNADPQLTLMDAAAEREAGMPSAAECVDFLNRVEAAGIDGEHATTRFAGFDDNEKSATSLTGGRSNKGMVGEPPLPPLPNDGNEAGDKTKTRSGR